MTVRYSKIHTVRGKILYHCAGQNLRGVGILRQLFTRRPEILVVGGIKALPKAGRAFYCAAAHVCHEGNADVCAILKSNPSPAGDIVQKPSANAKKSERRREQKEADAVLRVPLADFGDDRKRRVVDHNRVAVVRYGLIVAARIERPEHLKARETIFFNGPSFCHLVDILGCVAVVRGFLRRELFQKRLIPRIIFRQGIILEGSGARFSRAVQRLRYLRTDPLEVKPAQIQCGQLPGQQTEIPRALVGLVVHDPQRRYLLRRQVGDADAGDFLHAQLLGRQHPAVADHDHAVGIHHHRLDKAVLPDALRHVGHLAGIMLLRVGGIGDDIRQPPHFDLHASSFLRSASVTLSAPCICAVRPCRLGASRCCAAGAIISLPIGL